MNPDWASIIMLITEFTLSGVIGLIVYMFRSLNGLKEELNNLKVQIAREHLTKDEMRQMLKELAENIHIQLTAMRREYRP